MNQWTACVRVATVYHRVEIFRDRDGEKIPLNATAQKCQTVIDKLLTLVFGTIGRFTARVVGTDVVMNLLMPIVTICCRDESKGTSESLPRQLVLPACSFKHRSLGDQVKDDFIYLAYRVETEVEYLRQFSGTFQYLERTYRWWRYNFPEYVIPSSLPNPPGTPPVQPSWTVAPLIALQRNIPIWEMKLDNLLLFGHTMPTNAEVEYRKSYLKWSDDFKRGIYRPLPVEDIVRDTKTVHVPVYEYPFVHEELWRWLEAHVRSVAAKRLPVLGVREPDTLPPLPRHWVNFVLYRDEEGRWDVARPAQLLLPVPTEEDMHEDPSADEGRALEASEEKTRELKGGVAGAEEMRAAAKDMRVAAEDAWHLFGAARGAASSLAPLALAFLSDRLNTLRAALSQFMEGYAQGTKEVESGAVDVVGDAQQFYNKMLHTLPDALASLDNSFNQSGSSENAKPPQAGTVSSTRSDGSVHLGGSTLDTSVKAPAAQSTTSISEKGPEGSEKIQSVNQRGETVDVGISDDRKLQRGIQEDAVAKHPADVAAGGIAGGVEAEKFNDGSTGPQGSKGGSDRS